MLLDQEASLSQIQNLVAFEQCCPKYGNHFSCYLILPQSVQVNKEGKSYIEVRVKDGETKVFSPEEISIMIRGKKKETTELYLSHSIKKEKCWNLEEEMREKK